jgi:hypothetical protein
MFSFEGCRFFFCGLEILHEGLGIGNSSKYGTGSGLDPDPDWYRIQPKRLDPDQDTYQMNTDPKQWIFHCSGLQILNTVLC